MPTATKKKSTSRRVTLTRLDKKPKICRFSMSATAPSGMKINMTAPQVLPSFMHALIRCAQWTAASPDPLHKPDAKPDYVFLDKDQLGQLKEQILVVLADYQNTGVTQCPRCCKPFADVVQKCPECGTDSYAFTRTEGTRIEVANRILANLGIIGAGFGPEEESGG